jgi:hypothetical protein
MSQLSAGILIVVCDMVEYWSQAECVMQCEPEGEDVGRPNASGLATTIVWSSVEQSLETQKNIGWS